MKRIKEIISKEPTLIFTLLNHFLLNFALFGFLNMFIVYCLTVLGITDSIGFSNIYTLSCFGILIYQISIGEYGIYVTNEINKKPPNFKRPLIYCFCIIVFSYLIRYCIYFNHFILIIILSMTYVLLNLACIHLISLSN